MRWGAKNLSQRSVPVFTCEVSVFMSKLRACQRCFEALWVQDSKLRSSWIASISNMRFLNSWRGNIIKNSTIEAGAPSPQRERKRTVCPKRNERTSEKRADKVCF
mmetsp:Transcript_522/g.935  ORF Transcript_522/g.935 Transcript_522/m.935 type:complete len:105 (-) Transcript_522:705-1019(-)